MKKQNKKQGFTLVELLVVIAILAILATVSIVGYTAFIKKAHQSNAETEANQLEEVIHADFLAGEDFVIGEVTTGEAAAATTTTYILRYADGHAEYEVVTTVAETNAWVSTTTVRFNDTSKKYEVVVTMPNETAGQPDVEKKYETLTTADNTWTASTATTGVTPTEVSIDVDINTIFGKNADLKSLLEHAKITLKCDGSNLSLVYDYLDYDDVENIEIDLNSIIK